MSRTAATSLKFGVFALIMVVLTAFLFIAFRGYRGSSNAQYSAVFANVTDLKAGDSVRAAGIQVGTVRSVRLQPDKTVVVDFDSERNVVLTEGTRLAVRYLNLVGDRYLELREGPGDTRTAAEGTRFPAGSTEPALDLDVLLGGLKPVVQGLAPQDVNALTSSLIQILQGEGGTMDSLFARTSSFSNTLADNADLLQRVIDNLNSAIATFADDGRRFEGAISSLRELVARLSDQREPIGAAIDALSNGTASLSDLMGGVRPPLTASVQQLNRLAPALEAGKDRIDAVLQRSPENYRKLARIGSYGSFFNYYLCGVTFRVSDLQGRTAVFPWIKQDTGRCAENP